MKILKFLLVMFIFSFYVSFSPYTVTGEEGISKSHINNLGFKPVSESNRCNQPLSHLKLPEGFKAEAIIDTSNPAQSHFAKQADMNALDPSERYLFQTHEIFNSILAMTIPSVTRFDIQTGKYDVVATGLVAADGLKATPWGTLLVGEEHSNGSVWEILDPYAVDKNVRRSALGTFAHEGIVVMKNGTIYLADEDKTGAIYKFIPDKYSNLSKGMLYALKVKSGDTGEGEWILITEPDNARAEAKAKGATGYYRPEDMELGPDNLIYIAVTGNADDKIYGKIIRLDDNGAKPVIQAFANGGYNEGKLEFTMPDNLAFDKKGNLYITEDPSDSFIRTTNRTDDVWVALPDKDGDGMSDGLYRFLSIETCEGEPSGIFFDKSGKKLYLNIVPNKPHGRSATYVVTGFKN